MKLIYYSTAYHASHGGSIQSKLFYKTLVGNVAGHEILLYPSSTSNEADKIESGRGRYFRFRKFLRKIPLFQIVFFFRRNRFYLKGLFKLIDDERPDAIVMQLDSSFLQVKYVKRKYPDLIVTTQVNSSPFDEPFKNIAFLNYFRNKERKSLSHSDFNFFVSKNLQERIMRKSVNETRDLVIHNGVDTSVFTPMNKVEMRKQFQLPKEKFVIGYVGTLDDHKRVDHLINAFDKLKNLEDLSLIIVGDGYRYNSLANQVGVLGLEERIQFTGWLSHEDIPRYLNTFDIAVHHYANDYMSPLKLFEYMAAGLPVIGPDIPAVREVFKDNRHLILVEKSDVDALAKQIYRLYSDEKLRKEVSSEGHKYVLNNFTWNEYVRQVLKAIFSKMN